MTSKFFEIPSVGPIEIAKHHKTKRITLKLRNGKPPKVVIPTLMTYKMGYNFAVEKQNWIIQNQQKLAERAPIQNKFKNGSVFKTRFHIINIFMEGDKTKVNKSNNEITLFLPKSTNIESEASQETIRGFITEILRTEAKKHLIPRVELLASQYGFKYKNVFIKNLKSRWGSCSSVNNINLNLHLMRLPEQLSDFIVLHELCHTVHKNHDPKFHELLNAISGNEKIFNKELRKYNIDF